MDKETPITKYLATLERRQAQMGMLIGSPSPGVSPDSRSPVNIRQRLRFEDETFLQPHNQSLFHFSPPPSLAAPSNSNNPGQFGSGSGRSTVNNILSQFKSSSSTNSAGKGRQLTICEEEENFVGQMSYKRKRYSFEQELEDKADAEKKMSELERLLRTTQAELLEARALNTTLERQKLDMKRIYGEKIINDERSYNEMRVKCRDSVEQMEELKKQLDKAVKKNEEVTERFHKQAKSHAEEKAVLDSKMSKLQSENVELKQKYEEDKLNLSGSVKKMTTELEESSRGTEKWSVDCQMLKDQLALKDTQLAKYQQELKEIQSIKFKYEELKNKLEEMNSSESQAHLLEEKLKKFENMYVKQQNENNRLTTTLTKVSEENDILKSSMKREMLLEEQVTTLENEVKLLRDFLNKKAEVEADRDSFKERLNSWTTVAGKFDPECNAAHKFEAYVRQMQNTLLEMKHDITNMKCTIDNQTAINNKLQSEVTNLRQEANSLKEEKEKISAEFKQISRRLLLITMDRDGLKSLKESYEQELEGVISAALKERVNQLEELIVDYEKIIHEDPSTRKSCGECEKRMALISELRTEIEKLRNERETSVAPDVTMSEDGNTTGIKIVAFGMNPSTLSMEARVKELIAENERLADKLKQYDEQSMLTPVDPAVVEEKKKIEEQLKTLERKHEILTEAYNYETQQLQTALNKLFGFHVTLVRDPQSQFRLQSIYAQNPDEMFIFQEAENTDMMLLETPVLDHFRDDIDKFLLREGSIPAFLSSVTIAFCQANYQQQSVDVNASDLPSSQQSEQEQAPDTFSVDARRTVQVEIEGHSDNEESDVEGEEHTEEEEDYDENVDERELPEEYEEEESENDPEDEDHHDEDPDTHGESDGEVVCIDSD